MRVLALDTTTRAGSVALVENGRIVAERHGDETLSHAERLPRDLIRLIEDCGVELAEIAVFGVAAGPGSFTGLRIGIATIQGLAFVTGRRVAAVSALDALAHVAAADRSPGRRVAAWMNAYRGEVFAALYSTREAPAGSAGRVELVDGPLVDAPERILLRWSGVDVHIGDGATAYAHVIGSNGRVLPAPDLAGMIGLMAHARATAGDTVDPAGIQPIYIRRPDAELAKEKARDVAR